MRLKSNIAFTSLFLVLMILISACGNNAGGNTASPAATNQSGTTGVNETGSNETEAGKLDPVELTWYFPNTPQNMKDVAMVQDAMNVIVQSKINAKIKLIPVDWGTYDQKMNVMTGAGDTFDLMFTAPWSNNYFQNVSKGALLPLDDLLTEYAPTLKAAVPDSVWNAARVNQKIYGAINWQIIAMPYGLQVNQSYIDKYKIDLNAVQKYEDMEPYLAAWNESYDPLNYAKDDADPFTRQPPYFEMDSIGEDTSVGWIRLDDSETQVFNQYASDEFKGFVQLMRKWYQAGYFPKDAALRTSVERAADAKAGKISLFGIGSPIKPGVELEAKASLNVDQKFKPLSKAIITTNRSIATMTGISATSKNPERAMMFLELMNSDKELYNLICNGIEGVHYNKTADNVIEKVKDNNGYNPVTDWLFGNQFNAYYTSPDAVGIWEETLELNLTADASPLLGFTFNPDPIKSEIAQTNAVYAQYKDALLSGTADPDKLLPEFLDKLNKAGAEKVIAEKQRQIEEWKKIR
ncbi:ABC transporter substrate-binding protein [Paenibacillus eucommiae]|uniref:Aldouronate transport system substrate-binding protein n=1 Tax=Paenibacillus eucommiae TaxID=1355755 RepID=A0ABS4J3S6_9BACL|nr:ABC transporter substrate-binding protein [Paenibacillus eucommiae]MBP1994493.1 putative aldouronate transport system substrate-binding protein [Paenibacillus eucommiae]